VEALQKAPLRRKQFLVTEDNVIKLESIAKSQNTSVTRVVREAIDAYDPQAMDSIDDSELMELVSSRLKKAIKDTRTTRRRLNKTLKKLEAAS